MENYTPQARIQQMMQDLSLNIKDLASICDKSESTIRNAISGRSEFPGYLYLALESHERAKTYLTGAMEDAVKNKDAKGIRNAQKYRLDICGM